MKSDRKTVVSVAFADGKKKWPGYTTCSPHFRIARAPKFPGLDSERWHLIHAPTGKCVRWCRTLFEARMFAAVFAGFPYDFGGKKASLAECAEQCPWLVKWMYATGHVMYSL